MRSRVIASISILTIAQLHGMLFCDVENSPCGMLMYHGSAAMCDFATIIIAAHVLRGRISIDMQYLCMSSMIINFIGWVAYLIYFKPDAYDAAIRVLTCAQFVRLLLIGRFDAEYHPWRALFYRANPVG